MAKILKSLATLGKFGYLPAPGTVGTIVTLPVAYALSYASNYVQLLIILALSGVGYFIIKGALKYFRMSDPSQIILDEVIGTLVTFYDLPYELQTFVAGFLLFRFFDIFKPLGIRYFEKLPGAFGVLSDDIVAGLIANLLLRFLLL